jgi:menaquinone-dependent protoporphyrinogen oxidase
MVIRARKLSTSRAYSDVPNYGVTSPQLSGCTQVAFPDCTRTRLRNPLRMTDTTRADASRQSPASVKHGGVLVAYATRFGSTEGVARRIADGLRKAGHPVELREVEADIDAGAYSAVILGSAVFNQRWLPEAEEFVRRNTDRLRTRPVWLFSVGTFGDRRPIIGRLMRREPKSIGATEAAIHPREYRVFAGVIDKGHWPALSRLFYHALGGHLGDNRDWHEIDAWADRIRDALVELRP